MPTVYLKPGRVKPLLYRHPWVFADSIARLDGEAAPGDVVDVRAPDGRFLARGFWSDRSALRVRGFAFEEGLEPDAAWVLARIERAARFRRDVLALPGPDTDCYRVVHGDADGLPGLVVDRLGEHMAIQITSSGLEARREAILDALERLFEPTSIVENADLSTREKEGLGPVERRQRGAPPEDGRALVREHGVTYEVDLLAGQKTGFFCDQREARAAVRALAGGRRVLDAFCYTGAFALNAAKGGAEHVEALDSSPVAVDAARANAERNGVVIGLQRADAFKALGEWRHADRRFDLVVLDPPKYAKSRRDLEGALRKYRELYALGAQVTSPGGVLVACTCSGLVEDRDLEAVLREVVRQVGREIVVFRREEQAPDHPVSVTCPEGRYLRAWFCHVA